jgi:O-antigen/teichoic acid export membrane protein
MQSELRRKVVKNASANLIRLAGSGLVALLLPPFLVRMLSRDAYGAWALVLQMTLYVGYFDFGIQTAVARFVAHSDELKDTRQRDGIVSTAFVLLTLAAALGCVMIAVLAWQLPHLFPRMPLTLYPPARTALLVMGGSFALGLPVSAIHAVFIGFQRNEIPAVLSIINKLSMALLVCAVVLRHRGLAEMGLAVATANLLSYFGAYAAFRRWAGQVRVRISLISKAIARQIASYSSSVVVSMAAMLMISGLDLTIVGAIDYKSTAYYAIAATLTNFLAQAQGAIFAALLPASAVLAARGDSQQLGTLLISSTRYGMLILLAGALPLIVAGHFVISIWASPSYARYSTTLLQVLLIANVVRLSALPYSTLLLGTGQQTKVILSPLAEGVTNFTASVAGAYAMGAIGVALGTLLGAFVGLGLHVFYNMPRTSLISISRRRLILDGFARPLACAVPFGWLLFHSSMPRLSAQTEISLAVMSSVGAALIFWHYGLVRSEKQKVAHALRLL